MEPSAWFSRPSCSRCLLLGSIFNIYEASARHSPAVQRTPRAREREEEVGGRGGEASFMSDSPPRRDSYRHPDALRLSSILPACVCCSAEHVRAAEPTRADACSPVAASAPACTRPDCYSPPSLQTRPRVLLPMGDAHRPTFWDASLATSPRGTDQSPKWIRFNLFVSRGFRLLGLCTLAHTLRTY